MSEAEPGLTEAMWTGLVRRPDYDEYSARYRDFFAMRRKEGIIELRMHRDGGPYYQTMASHNAWGQAWLEVGNDPLNQVLILTGTGEKWFDGGTKRAAYHMYTSHPVDARSALEYGLVNEVLPRDQLLRRAWELAEMIMRRPRGARRVTHAIASRPWKQRVVSDFSSQLYGQGYALFTDAERAGRPPADEDLSEHPL